MLARSARLHRRDEFRIATRQGRRVSAPGLVLHAHVDPDRPAPRVGFVVGRPVGPAVTRNRVRRRLQHLVAARLERLPSGTRLVVRATPAAADRSFERLGAALDDALSRAFRA
ncbi:MAG TPA: ribonuclease P protein component [Mycobacteriales bacterium]|nr:ribonuclease P protein component [Mycobacteriales bacterium]HVX70321.1 ribonuclease P protein component [Mycobacteriales bacterium]